MHPISDLQIEYSVISRGIERLILPAARELGIGITAYGVLSRGLISGHWSRTRRRDSLHEALGAADLQLRPDDIARLESLVPPNAAAGERYHPSQMAHLDSEMG